MPLLCALNVQDIAIVIKRSPTSNTGSVTLFLSHHGVEEEFEVEFSTTCPYLSVPSGTQTVYDNVIPAPYTDPIGLEPTFNWNTDGYDNDCGGVEQCGTFTITSYQIGCEGQTLELPVYIWTVCEANDSQYSCGGTMPQAIWVDKEDPSTWSQLLPVIPDGDSIWELDVNSCPYVTSYDAGQVNPHTSGVVFAIEFDFSSFEECGENILACSLTLSKPKDEIPCTIDFPIYVTNTCPNFDCPIDVNPNSVSINKNAGDNGGFSISVINNQNYGVELTATSDCPYIVIEEPTTTMIGNEILNAVFQYDITNFQTCGSTPCGIITITATYEGAEGAAGRETLTCTRTIDVTIDYECDDEEEGGFETSLEDDDGNSTVVIDDLCEQITLYDNSTGFTESGHGASDYTDYRTITFTHLQTGGTYVMSSIAGADELIPALSSGVTQFFHNVSDGGIYEVVLCNVPTHNISASYQDHDDVVWSNGQLYACITDNQGQPPISNPDDWKPITADEIGNYSQKYCAKQLVLSSCTLESCFANKMHDILCVIDCNHDDLCKNRDLMDAVKFIFLVVAMKEALDQDDWDAVILIYDKISQICNC